jgi:hypothetical protein
MKRKYAVGLAAAIITTLFLSALALRWHVSKGSEGLLAKSREDVIDDMVQKRIQSEFGGRTAFIKMLKARGMTYERFRQQVKQKVEAKPTKP